MKKLTQLFLLLVLLLALWGGAVVAQGPDEPTADAAQDALETFEPTEKVPADNAVSFPVDI